MKLYGYYRSSASYRVRIILNFKGLSWDYVPVMLNLGEHRGDAFRAINPMGFVPVLADGDARISQSPAIAEYLEERHTSPALLPADPVGRAGVREIQNLIGCDIHPLQNLRVLRHLREAFGQGEAATAAWCRHWIGAGFDAVEQLAQARSAAGRFCVGDTPTLADVWLVPQLYNARRWELDLAPWPTLSGIGRHCEAIDAFAAAHPARQPDAPAD
jgi:maleylpyruvate isomerase